MIGRLDAGRLRDVIKAIGDVIDSMTIVAARRNSVAASAGRPSCSSTCPTKAWFIDSRARKSVSIGLASTSFSKIARARS